MHHVEFVGGPLDGYRHAFWHKPSRLPTVARLAVNPDLIQSLSDKKRNAAGPATSTAVYCIGQSGKRLRYFYIASAAVGSEQPTTPEKP
jgi:hypothetical protein